MTSRPAIDDTFDLPLADSLARLESFNKHLYRPHAYLHKWWARRCGTTFRLILKHLVRDPACVDHYAPGGLDGYTILDPMMGGGTTLHEAIRLGANVVGMDVDPIPVVQARAALTPIPLGRLQEAFEAFYTMLRTRMSDVYRSRCPLCGAEAEVQFILHGWRKTCACGPVVCVDSVVLRHEPDGSTTTICPRCQAIGRNGLCVCDRRSSKSQVSLVEKGVSRCTRCGEPYCEDTATPFYNRYAPLVVVGSCRGHGLFFKAPSDGDLETHRHADACRPMLANAEDFAIKPGPKSAALIRRGITSYLDLFSSRQLQYLTHAISAVEDLEPGIRLNLGLLVSTSLEFNSMLCGYKGGNKRRPGAIRHTFSHHAYSFPYTALENNPLYPGKRSGTLQSLFHARIARGRLWAMAPKERVVGGAAKKMVPLPGELNLGTEVSSSEELACGTRKFLLVQGSAASIGLASNSVDHVVTDPPYFDSVQYSDLAAYFRVWLHRLLPGFAQWDYDMADAAVETHGSRNNDRYIGSLAAIFSECRRVLKKDGGRLVFTFHHGNTRGWSALTVALKRSGFVLISRYIVHSENVSSVHIVNLKALRHDAILVAAPLGCGLRHQWVRPQKLDATNSRTFCESCASALGWMLAAGLSERDVLATWNSLTTVS